MSAGEAVSSTLIAPGITPWKTTLPGVDDGANNPGIRVFQYDQRSLHLQDMITYYLDLKKANGGTSEPTWNQEYSLRKDFSLLNVSTAALDSLLRQMHSDPDLFQKYYNYNSVSYDLRPCDAACREDHYCAIREVDFERYSTCFVRSIACPRSAPRAPVLALLALLVTASLR